MVMSGFLVGIEQRPEARVSEPLGEGVRSHLYSAVLQYSNQGGSQDERPTEAGRRAADQRSWGRRGFYLPLRTGKLVGNSGGISGPSSAAPVRISANVENPVRVPRTDAIRRTAHDDRPVARRLPRFEGVLDVLGAQTHRRRIGALAVEDDVGEHAFLPRHRANQDLLAALDGDRAVVEPHGRRQLAQGLRPRRCRLRWLRLTRRAILYRGTPRRLVLRRLPVGRRLSPVASPPTRAPNRETRSFGQAARS